MAIELDQAFKVFLGPGIDHAKSRGLGIGFAIGGQPGLRNREHRQAHTATRRDPDRRPV
jgi:hypothetical protein